jgi:hypothetical protein
MPPAATAWPPAAGKGKPAAFHCKARGFCKCLNMTIR